MDEEDGYGKKKVDPRLGCPRPRGDACVAPKPKLEPLQQIKQTRRRYGFWLPFLKGGPDNSGPAELSGRPKAARGPINGGPTPRHP